MERRVALVRSAGRADAFAIALRDHGYVPVLVAPFRYEAVEGSDVVLEAALATGPAWVAVTSPHVLPALEPLAPMLTSLRLAAVGQGTASALHAAGIGPALVGDAGATALARRMLAAGVRAGDTVVHPCAEEARGELRAALVAAGVNLVSVPVYRMVPDPVGERSAQGDFWAAVISSPRLAARAAELFPGRPRAVAVGRTTAAALRDLGWRPAAVAARPTPEDVARALDSLRPPT